MLRRVYRAVRYEERESLPGAAFGELLMPGERRSSDDGDDHAGKGFAVSRAGFCCCCGDCVRILGG